MYEQGYDRAEAIETRQTHVGSSISEAEESAQALVESIRELERRLSDVLRPEQDNPAKMAGEPRPALVSLAERLTSHGGTIRMARQYVVSILDRLEL